MDELNMNSYCVQFKTDAVATQFWAKSLEDLQERLLTEGWIQSLSEVEIWMS